MPVTATPAPLTPPEVPHLPPKWTAVWITSLEEISDAKLVDLGYEHDIRPFGRAVFSREVALDAVPAHAWCHVAADSRYVLAVNGTEVGAGPVRSQPDRLCYDTYDVAALLRRGTNTIEATVTYYGTPNAFWMPPRGSVNFGKAPCLALEMRDGDGTLLTATDASWTCTPLTGWSLAEEPSVIGAGGLISVPNERYDATVAPAASRPDHHAPQLGQPLDAGRLPLQPAAPTSHRQS